MKAFFSLCVLAAVAFVQAQQLTAEQSAKLKEHVKICIESSKVDKQLVIDARAGKFAETPELYEFFTCVFKRVGFLDDNEKLQEDVIRAKAPAGLSKEVLDKGIQTCAKAQDAGAGKVAFAAYKCFKTESEVKIEIIEA
ncbi:hypothetical protein ILUMI_25025 [Ignelater luminosus]|uniref:Uncharacterized protein n=1 Tax=Ignelater luminosus TaxID=2038154 RepID=A0A8K0C965_IGNLU|nr:hypothetical protein ILUMI_25025 [Ignelater luminosus]